MHVFEGAEGSFLPSILHHFLMGLFHLYYRIFIIRDNFLMFKRSRKIMRGRSKCVLRLFSAGCRKRIRIWKCHTKSVNAGLKIKEYYEILVKDFKELTVVILNMHACFESRDSLLVKYFLYFLSISLPLIGLQEIPSRTSILR